ncbi:hypothetical protein SVAN01_00825 [Stagonosporopsis vannaccii]|nr:hypothetical protein SVAN01_00825 [Stagonosporopsis vannaccii]
MLSPNSISPKKAGRHLSTCSIDSGYGSGLHGDAKVGSSVGMVSQSCLLVILMDDFQLDARDLVHGNTIRQLQPRSSAPSLDPPTDLHVGGTIVAKREDDSSAPRTPRLTICTAISNPSSPDPPSPASPSDVRRSHARKSASKLPSQAVKQLNAWLSTNRHHPYPNAETKQALAEACSITIKQVTTWFTNMRQRQLKSQEDDGENAGYGHGHISHQASRKGKKKDYSRSNGASPIEGFLSPPRLSPSASISEFSSGEGDNWQCTFCRTSLTAKSWRRHEETQHHPKYQWTCLARGPRIQLPSSSISICAFCELQNPDDNHFLSFHRVGDCLCKAEHERTFGRPDHLHQHARNFHRCEQPLSELVRDAWRKDGPGMVDDMSWTCGFCQEVLPTWDARATHIASHFKAGLTMAQWRAYPIPQVMMPRGHTEPNGPAALDTLANMGVTLAGPSMPASNPVNYGHSQPIQPIVEAQPVPTTAIMPVPTAIQDLDLDPFYFYGNQIDTFDPCQPASTSYYPAVNDMPTASHNTGSSLMDFAVIGFDEFGDPVYDMSSMHSW